MPTLEEIIKAQRLKLIAREAALADQIEEMLQSAIDSLEREAIRAADLVELRIAQGANPLSAQLTQGRASAFLQQMREIVTDVAGDALTQVLQERRSLQIASAQDFVDAANASDVRAGVDPQAISRIALALSDGPVRRLFSNLPDLAAARARDALFTGIATGKNPRQTARAMTRAAGVVPQRAATISRTETLRAYRNAMLDRMKIAPEIEKWVWISARDRRTCAFCWAQHGRVFSTERQMATHPNCRCSQGPLPAGANTTALVGNGKASFDKLSAADQLHILGPAKFRAFRAGAIEIRDLIGSANHVDWGPIGFEKSLRAAVGNDLAREYYKRGPISIVKPPRPIRAPAPPPAPKRNPLPTKAELVDWNKSKGWEAVRNAHPGLIGPDTAPQRAVSYGSNDVRVPYKAAIAKNIGAELEARAATNPVLRSQLNDYARNSGGRGTTAGEKAADSMVSLWASTSADTHPQALAMQRTVSNEFKIPMAHLEDVIKKPTGFDGSSVLPGQIDKALQDHGELFKNFAQVQYSQTQAFLKANGVEEMVLYRGQGELTVPNLAPDKFSYANKVTLQPISSFSVEYDTASSFSAGGTKAVIAMKVPAAQIFATPATAIGCLIEGEFVVLGGAELPAHVIIKPEDFAPSGGNPFASQSPAALPAFTALVP